MTVPNRHAIRNAPSGIPSLASVGLGVDGDHGNREGDTQSVGVATGPAEESKPSGIGDAMIASP